MLTSPQVGEEAPDFRMPSNLQEEFHLYKELEQGPILLYFYLGDFAPNCSSYMNKLMAIAPQLKEAGVRLKAVNPDSLDSHRKWAERLGIEYELIHDRGQEVSKAYGAIVVNSPVTKGFTNREFFLIGKDRKIRFHWKADIPRDMPELDFVIEAVQRLKEEE
ncbi:MAG: redoxin domain-containing protein [Candidatus Methanomethylophilaceae archaeon]